MPAAPDPRAADVNIQDLFLNQARRDKVTVTIRMMDGAELQGRITNFDRFAILLDHAGGEYLLFKHAIATITAAAANVSQP